MGDLTLTVAVLWMPISTLERWIAKWKPAEVGVARAVEVCVAFAEGSSVLNDHIRKLMESTRELQSMTRHADLLRDLTKCLVPESVSRHIKLFQDLTQHLRQNSPLEQLERMRLAWAQSTRGLSAQAQTVQRLSEGFSESLRTNKLFETVHRFQDAFGGLEFRAAIPKNFFPSGRSDVVQHALTAIQAITKAIKEQPDDLVDVTPDDIRDAQEQVQAQLTPVTQGESVESKLERLIEAVNANTETVRSNKESLRQKVFWRIVVALLLAVVSQSFRAKAEDAVKHELHSNFHAHTSVLVNVALETGLPQFVGDLGLIERKVQIRAQPRRASLYVGQLVRGDVVTIVRKGRDWSKVQHCDQTGALVEGWILSRYLRPIR